MDHLPPPIDHGGHERVHFYASHLNDEYEPQDFFTLPKKYGYHDFQELVEEGLTEPMEENCANEFIQSWLWFALLAQVIGFKVYRKDFHRSDDTISTKKLNAYISSWIDREREAAEDSNKQLQNIRRARASMALETARRFISKHCAHDTLDRDDRSRLQSNSESECPYIGCSVDVRLDIKLTLSIAILGETLQLARPFSTPYLDDRAGFHHEPNTQDTHWGYSRYCRLSLQANKWCPFAVRRIESRRHGVTAIYLICKMKPPKPDSNHAPCTIWGCVAPTQPQTALHMSGCGGKCKTDKIDETKLVEWISQDKIPLVLWTEARGMECTAHDLKDRGPTFVALTHSWEDGLVDSGKDARNKNDRCMHSCQVESLQLTANRLLKDGSRNGSKEIYLWIDVLCVPREASVRGRAINQMKVIYSKAAKVLVWDRNLMQTRKISSPIEMNTRIRMSKWAQRLWTLQEAILAEDIHIQLQDDTVSVKELEDGRDRAREDIDHPYHHVWKAGQPFSTAVWRLRQPDEKHRVQLAWEAVQFRVVTDPRDEAIILANVLKLDVTRLEQVGATPKETTQESHGVVADNRMRIFLDMLDEHPDLGIPSGIIFLPPPKLPINGYGWAPRTWLTKQASSSPLLRPLRQAGSIMKKGFLVEFPGLLLQCPRKSLENETFWIPVQQGLHKWYKIVTDRGSKGQDFKDFWETYVCTASKPSIILSTHTIRDRWEIGVLVHTKGLLTKGEVRWVQILCRVWIRLETNTNVIRKQGDLFRNEPDAVLLGERLTSQKWCIDGAVEPEATLASDMPDFTAIGQKRRRTLNAGEIAAGVGKL